MIYSVYDMLRGRGLRAGEGVPELYNMMYSQQDYRYIGDIVIRNLFEGCMTWIKHAMTNPFTNNTPCSICCNPANLIEWGLLRHCNKQIVNMP